LKDFRGYREKGIASWYGSKFHGLRTSSGEPYDMFAMTAAHKTLPLPCYARVTNLRNGRSVIVKINDRGPFHDNRLIDLSYTAAWKLGIVGEGTGLVEVETINPGTPAPIQKTRTAVVDTQAPTRLEPAVATENPATSPSVPAAAVENPASNPLEPAVAAAENSATDPHEPVRVVEHPETVVKVAQTELPEPLPTAEVVMAKPETSGLFLQVGAFGNVDNAHRLKSRLETELDTGVRVEQHQLADTPIYRVRLGPIASVEMCDHLTTRLQGMGLPGARLVVR
jgi:rare lipoprotein A